MASEQKNECQALVKDNGKVIEIEVFLTLQMSHIQIHPVLFCILKSSIHSEPQLLVQ